MTETPAPPPPPTFWQTHKAKAVALLWGILGVILVLIAIHLWQDHRNLHGLIDMVVRQQQAQQQQRAAPTAPTPPQ